MCYSTLLISVRTTRGTRARVGRGTGARRAGARSGAFGPGPRRKVIIKTRAQVPRQRHTETQPRTELSAQWASGLARPVSRATPSPAPRGHGIFMSPHAETVPTATITRPCAWTPSNKVLMVAIDASDTGSIAGYLRPCAKAFGVCTNGPASVILLAWRRHVHTGCAAPSALQLAGRGQQ